MSRVRARHAYLCNDHLRQRLPISGALVVHVVPPLDCDDPHPDIENLLHEAAAELERVTA